MGVAASNVAVGHPVFYAGRFVHRVTGLPEGCELLGDWDVLPAQLAAAMERADTLVVLDPLSFPFEALTGTQQDVPLVVVLPWELDVDTLVTVFGEPVFARLGFFDRVATPDSSVWELLCRRYGWAEGQRVRPAAAARDRHRSGWDSRGRHRVPHGRGPVGAQAPSPRTAFGNGRAQPAG